MAGIEGLALDPYGEQLNQAGASLGKGIDTMVQRQKAEDEANAPVDPMTQLATKMQMLQQLHPDWTPEHLGRALQLYERGDMQHPELTPAERQPQGPRIQQTSPAYGPGGPPQQASAPAPQGLGAMAAAPTPGPQPGMELPQAPAQQTQPAPIAPPAAPAVSAPSTSAVGANVKSTLQGIKTGQPQPSPGLPPTQVSQGTPAGIATSRLQENIAAQPRPADLASSAAGGGKRPPDEPIVLSKSDKTVLDYKIRNKDLKNIQSSMAGKSSDIQLRGALKAQEEAGKLERLKLGIADRQLRLGATDESKSMLAAAGHASKMTEQDRDAVYKFALQQEEFSMKIAALEKAHRDAMEKGDQDAAIKLVELALKTEDDLTKHTVALASSIGASDEAKAAGLARVQDFGSRLGKLKGSANTLSSKYGMPTLFQGETTLPTTKTVPGKPGEGLFSSDEPAEELPVPPEYKGVPPPEPAGGPSPDDGFIAEEEKKSLRVRIKTGPNKGKVGHIFPSKFDAMVHEKVP